ncbi:MAG: hypothetical protein M3P95_10005 [Actinomycetota bacterium]|nr:hypothetical protein [Actinomycetota bacterium]
MEALTLEGREGTAAATGRLLAEFRWQVDEAEVRRVVQGCVRDLAGVPAGALPELVERSARQRLVTRTGASPR